MRLKHKTNNPSFSFPCRYKNKAGRAKQIALGLLAFFLFTGCSVNYLVNSSTPLTKESFSPDKRVGVAMFGNAAPDLYQTVSSQIKSYAEQELIFADITSGVTLNAGRAAIETMDELISQYPDMQYVLIVWQHTPETFKDYQFVSEGGNLAGSSSSTPVTASRDVAYYKTTLLITYETLLFDLTQKALLAKAIDTFSKTKTHEDEHFFKNKTFLGKAEDFLDSGPNDSKYPDLRFLEPNDFWSYFKTFLKNIGKKTTKSEMRKNQKLE